MKPENFADIFTPQNVQRHKMPGAASAACMADGLLLNDCRRQLGYTVTTVNGLTPAEILGVMRLDEETLRAAAIKTGYHTMLGRLMVDLLKGEGDLADQAWRAYCKAVGGV